MNDYERFNNKTQGEVNQLIFEYGQASDLDSTQNDSPTVREMLSLANKYPTITYSGYIIKKPRPDWRVSLDSFEFTELTAEQTLELMTEYRHADELSYDKVGDTYTFRAWWD